MDIIKYCDGLPQTTATRVISYQIIKSATSVGANYRAAFRARSNAEFHSKMSIVVEECDETEYWLEVIEACYNHNPPELKRLLQETSEILRVCSKARNTAAENKLKK